MIEIGYAYAIGAAVTWGLVYAIDQKILAEVSPMQLLFITTLIGLGMLLPFLFFSNGSLKDLASLERNTWVLIFLTTALATLASFFIFSGIKALDAPTASIIEIAYPFFVVLFSFLLFRSVPNVYFFIGGLLIFVGSVILIKLA